MKKIIFLILLLLLILVPAFVHAATNPAASSALSAVQAAVNASSDGDTVLIPNGTVTWTGGITTSKQITIRAENYTATPAGTSGAGATTRSVIINNNSSSDLFAFTTGNTYHQSIAGIRFNDSAGNAGSHISFTGSGTKVPLIQDCYFENSDAGTPNRQRIHISCRGGVMWNCYINGTHSIDIAGDTCFVIKDVPRQWNTASTMGMLDTGGDINFYVEDTTFKNVGNCPDIDVGGRAVVRYFIYDGAWAETHGFTSGIGGRHFEFYNGVWKITTLQRNIAARYMYLRAGTGVFTDNDVQNPPDPGYYGSPIQVSIGDTTAPGAYPQAQAPGWGHNGSTHILDPIYIWNQTGARAYTYGFNNGWGSVVLLNRELYVNNGAKPGYVKYTYPHPLRGAGGADTNAPTISGTNVNTITATTMIIHWETSENTTNRLSYGLTASYGTDLSQSEAASFDQAVTGLTASTLYYFRIIAGDAAGNKATNTLTASTIAVDSTPPSFTAGSTNVINITSSGATILGTVGETARSGVTWGYSTATSSGTATNGNTYSLTPSVVFSGATASTLVYVRFWVQDASGNTNSVLASFTTAAATAPGPKTYYVDQSAGNDNNTGLTNFPWKNCPGMRGTANYNGSGILLAGDTVYFDKGDTWLLSSAGAAQSAFKLTGGVKYVGDGWGTGTRAKLQLNAATQAGIVRMDSDDVLYETWLQGFEITSGGFTGTGVDVNHAFWSVGMTRAEKVITNNYIHDLYANSASGDYCYGIIVSDNSPDASGWVANVTIVNNICNIAPRDFICLYPGSYGMISNITVKGNYVTGAATDPNYSEGHGILAKGLVKNSTIEFNTISNMTSSAIFIDGPEAGTGHGPTNLVARHNILQTFDNNGTLRFYSLNAASISHANIYGNIFLTNSTTGAINMDGVVGTAIANIYNNTFVNTFVDIGNPATATINFSNNIIYSVGLTPFDDSSTKVTSHSNNVFYRTGAGTALAVRGGTTYTSGDLTTYEASALSSDPLFSNVASLPVGFVAGVPSPTGLNLQSGSPAVDSGGTISGGNGSSINGQARPYGSAWDRGAYEFATPDTTPPSISATNISSIVADRATATATTSEAAYGGIKWGTTTSVLDGGATNTSLKTSHSHLISGLAAATVEYVKWYFTDSAGNSTNTGAASFTSASAVTNVVATPPFRVRVVPTNP